MPHADFVLRTLTRTDHGYQLRLPPRWVEALGWAPGDGVRLELRDTGEIVLRWIGREGGVVYGRRGSRAGAD